MVPVDSDRISRVPPYSGYQTFKTELPILDFHFLWCGFPTSFSFFYLKIILVLQPQLCRNKIGLGYFRFARRYYGNHYCFLFLWVLRCFSSPGLPPYGYLTYVRWVAPFGNLGIKTYLQFSQAYRSLSRPSSPLRA